MILLSDQEVTDFQHAILTYYKANRRSFPWRETANPYKILVSEIMLQQTQTTRSVSKYNEFISLFPNFQKLAEAPTVSVLSAWQGLGYNRRALYLQRAAQTVMSEYSGVLPESVEHVDALAGIGYATACAICTYSFNMVVPFIETNIRTVFIHNFFNESEPVHDRELMPLVERTIDSSNPRDWYYALMDYGVMLKKTHKNPGRNSAHYVKQSSFEGSHRQQRGKILKLLLNAQQALDESAIQNAVGESKHPIVDTLKQLEQEGFVIRDNNAYLIKK